MRRGYADTSLGQVHYVSGGTGTPLVLLPQAGRSSRMFAAALPLLARRYRAIALDLPGFGPPSRLPGDLTIEKLAECLIEAFDGLGVERAHLYGLHTGNKIATAAAVGWPARLETLILAGQSHSLIPDQARRNDAISKVLGKHPDEAREATAASARAASWAAAFRGIADIWWSERLVAGGMREEDVDQACRRVLDGIETMAATPIVYRANFAYDLGAAFRKVSVPTLIIEIATPQEDRLIGRQGALVRSLIPGSSLVTIEDGREGIVTLEDRPADLAAALFKFIG